MNLSKYDMASLIAGLLILTVFATASYSQTHQLRRSVLEQVARRNYRPTFSAVTAKLLTNIDTATAYDQLDTLLSKEYGDMFWMYGCAGLYFSCEHILPEHYKKEIRRCWKLYTPYRGDTDNHFLMYYGSLFLFAEEWDSLPRSGWFLGKSSKEIRAESRQWLEHWFHEVLTSGQSEFDSPRYLYYYLTPLGLLSEYSKDSVIRHDSKVVLDLLLAEYAALYLNGSYTGAHSRQSNDAALMPISAECTAYGEYFFEQKVEHLLPDIAFLAATNYTVDPIIKRIAHLGEVPFEVVQNEHSRRRIRFSSPPIVPVKKYTYMAGAYSLGSLAGGIIQPIQQQSWSLVLASDKKYNCITGLHPFYSATELGTFFPEEPSFMLEKIEGVKTGYTSADKFIGASPCETIWQRKNQLRCTYNIPADAHHQHVDLFLPDWGKIKTCDSTVWHQIVAMYGDVIVTITIATDFSMSELPGGYRLRLALDEGKTAYWLSVSTGDRHTDGRDAFMFSGNASYSDKAVSKWRILSPYLRLRSDADSFIVTDGETEKTIALWKPPIKKAKKKAVEVHQKRKKK